MRGDMIKRLILFVIGFITVFFCGSFLEAIEPSKPAHYYKHQVWMTDNGLPQNSIVSITQTSDGYLWLATERGVVRFDGIKFDLFNQENVPAFTNDYVAVLLVDHSGSLLIASRTGGIIRYKDDRFETVIPPVKFLDNEIWCMIESHDHALWIGTRKGLYRFYDGNLSLIPLPGNVPNHFIKALLEDRMGRIWIGTRGEGVRVIKKIGDRFEAESRGLDNIKISSILEDRRGITWIGTSDSGLIRLDGMSQKKFDIKNGLRDKNINTLYEDRAGNIWIGSFGGGVQVIPAGSDTISNFNLGDELSSNVIFTIFEDRESTLWIGTDGGGLNGFRDSRIITFTRKNGLPGDNIKSIFQDSAGTVWIGTKGGGIAMFDPQNERVLPFPSFKSIPSNFVASICEYPDGYIWFGTLGGGICRLNLKTKNMDYYLVNEEFSSRSVRALIVDSKGNPWAGTDSGKIFHFENGRFVPVLNINARINTFLHETPDSFLAGTYGAGICRVANGKIEFLNDSLHFPDKMIISLFKDSSGFLWIGTNNKGLFCLHNGVLTSIGKKNGLPDDIIYYFLEDRKNYLWMSSNKGIFSLSRDEIDDFLALKRSRMNFSSYGLKDGMKSIECNGGSQSAGLRSRDGRLWFPTTLGASVIDPDNVGETTPLPQIRIESVYINRVLHTVEKMAVIPSWEGSLVIHYTAPSFIVPEKINFKYKLEGLDSGWIDAGTRRIASYTALPPGRYTFYVTACTGEGDWIRSPDSFEFLVKDKFFRSTLFKILLVFFIIGIVVLIYYAYRRVRQNKVSPNITVKYKGSNLDPESSKIYLQKIIYLVEVEKIYCDPNTSLKSISMKLNISPRLISQVINAELKKSFYEWINYYRIKEAQRLLADPRFKEKSIIDIAYSTGFNTKSAFNRVFKQFTGMTPSMYKKSGKRE